MSEYSDRNTAEQYAERLRGIKVPLEFSVIAKRDGEAFEICENGTESRKITAVGLKQAHLLISEIFARRGNINAVIFACPPFCARCAEQMAQFRPGLDDMAQIVGTKAVTFERSETEKILRALKKYNACLIRSAEHSGVIAVGRSLENALAAVMIMEKSAQIDTESKYIGTVRPVPGFMAFVMHVLYNVDYGKREERRKVQTEEDLHRSIPEDEMALRRTIIEYGIKLSDENLVQGTWGNISVRLDDRYMLVTPSGLAYSGLDPLDIVRVDINTLKYEGVVRPTTERRFHAALLKAYPRIRCIMHSHPDNCGVFAATDADLPILDPEDRALLGDVIPNSKSAIPGTSKLARIIVEAVKDSPGCVMGNHGILVCGESVEEAFERCRAMERAARRYLDQAEKK